jgi:uncharacterized protein YbjQ (UPF0145 family)
LSDNDNSDDHKDKRDLTRIEDLSEFLHSEDDDDLSDLATDPDYKLPKELNESSETDFNALEDENDEPPRDEFPEIPETETETEAVDNFNSEDDVGFGVETEDGFTSEPEDDFGIETEDEFNSEDETDFGIETEDDINSEDETDFGIETEDDFTSEDETDFGIETEGDFTSEPDADFGNEIEDEFISETDFGSESDDEFSSEPEVNFESDTEDDFEVEPEDSSTSINETIDEFDEFDNTDFLNEQENDLDKNINHTSFNQEDKTELPKFEQTDKYEAPENFKQLQQFAKNMSYGNMAKEGTPPFSIIIKDVKFEEDVEDILILLKEFKVIDEEAEESARQSLERGNMLLPRLGEYSAITICHKLRRFDINILMGLTEEINPPKSYNSDDSGLTTKNNIYNNRKHNWNFDNHDIGIQDIIVSTTPTLNGHDITEYITVATEFIMVDMENFTNNKEEQDKIVTSQIENAISENSNNDFFSANMNLVSSTEKLSINDIYKSLIEKLKSQAMDKNANAVVGITFQVSPILVDDNNSIKSRYQLTCSGSIVWATKK